MAKTEAQLRATRKWENNNYDIVAVRLPKGTKARIEALGESYNSIGVRAILNELDKLEKDGK